MSFYIRCHVSLILIWSCLWFVAILWSPVLVRVLYKLLYTAQNKQKYKARTKKIQAIMRCRQKIKIKNSSKNFDYDMLKNWNLNSGANEGETVNRCA